MVSMKLVVGVLAVIFIAVQAHPGNKWWGDDPRGFNGPRGMGGGGRNGRGGFGGHGGGFGFIPCREPRWFAHQLDNSTIEQVKALWANFRAASNNQTINQSACAEIMKQQEVIIQAGLENYVVTQAASLNTTARAIFNQYKQATDAFESAPVEVQRELENFFMRVVMPILGPGYQGGLGRRG